jgi:hypothetical protein
VIARLLTRSGRQFEHLHDGTLLGLGVSIYWSWRAILVATALAGTLLNEGRQMGLSWKDLSMSFLFSEIHARNHKYRLL